MAYPDAEVLDWASAASDTEVKVLCGLPHDGSPWLLPAGNHEVVLRVAGAEHTAETATEVAAVRYAARMTGAVVPVADQVRARAHHLRTGDARNLGHGANQLGQAHPGIGAPGPEPADRGRGLASMRREQGESDVLRAAGLAIADGRRKAVPEALRDDGWDVITLAEHYGVPADEHVADSDWIEEAAKRGWPILMRDKRIRHRPAEIAAVTKYKACCFVITRGDLSSADMAQRFITNKVAILAAAVDAGPYIYSVQRDRITRLYP